jgi:hypothetical protein
MSEAEFLTPKVAEASMSQPLRVQSPSFDMMEAPYFIDLVKAEPARKTMK